jgi:hypothetical protein
MRALGFAVAFAIDPNSVSFLTEAAGYFSFAIAGLILCIVSASKSTRDSRYGAEDTVIVPETFERRCFAETEPARDSKGDTIKIETCSYLTSARVRGSTARYSIPICALFQLHNWGLQVIIRVKQSAAISLKYVTSTLAGSKASRCSDSRPIPTFFVKRQEPPSQPISRCAMPYKLFSSSKTSLKLSAYFITSCFDGLGNGRLARPP